MLQRRQILYGTLSSVLLLLCGCGRIVQWTKGNFYQGDTLENEQEEAQRFVRTIVAYDQFTTVARFDALWLSDHVRTLYAQAHVRKYARSSEQYNAFLRRQLEENNHFIAFYVLCDYEHVLGDAQSSWSIVLKIDDNYYTPIEIKSVELSPIYQAFFGPRYNRFQVAYYVKFDAQNIEENDLIGDKTEKIALYFKSLGKEVALVWDILHHENHV
ncbi:MAG TPA: hypothetical protein VEK38_02530 [Candidatus Bathyarchaeia archaeon]|nr:hypothetical protein [Candidatus Bathyarchaeia archaeon]